jgi:Transglycosylase-like domain
MEHLYFGARAQRKVRRRKLIIASWFIGVIATFLGVPGSNAVLSVFRTVTPSHAAAGSLAAAESARTGEGSVGSGVQGSPHGGDQMLAVPKPVPTPSQSQATRPHGKHKANTERKTTPDPPPSPTSTPSASPTPAVSPGPPVGSVSGVIYAAAAEVGVSGSYLLSVADCESGLNPQAHNLAGYYGLFQFDERTWMSYGYGSIYDPVAQSRTAARLIAAGQARRWPNCA